MCTWHDLVARNSKNDGREIAKAFHFLLSLSCVPAQRAVTPNTTKPSIVVVSIFKHRLLNLRLAV